MKEERRLISKQYFENKAPCLVHYPYSEGHAKVFIAPTGETFGYGNCASYISLEDLTEKDSEQLLQMFMGEVLPIETQSDLNEFTEKLIEDFEWMRGHYGKPHIPHPSEIQNIEDRYFAITQQLQNSESLHA